MSAVYGTLQVMMILSEDRATRSPLPLLCQHNSLLFNMEESLEAGLNCSLLTCVQAH